MSGKNGENSSKDSHKDLNDEAHEDHHVHFPESDDPSAESHLITVQSVDQHKFLVHLGFIQYYHRYKINFDLPFITKDVPGGYHEKPSLQHFQNSNFQVLEVIQKNDCVGLTLEYMPTKDHLVKDEYDIDVFGHSLSITLISRVLGAGKGTPSLRTGLKCIGNEIEIASDKSDWKGFD